MAPLIIISLHNGPHRVQIYFPQNFATVLGHCIHKEQYTH